MKNTGIKIETGIPIPRQKRKNSLSGKFPIEDLKPGESFKATIDLIDNKDLTGNRTKYQVLRDRINMTAVYVRKKYPDRKYTTRSFPDEEFVRCWRIK
jgi:hypothetical protein